MQKQTSNKKTGRLAQKTQIYQETINLCAEFRSFTESAHGQSLLEIYNNSMMDYLSFLSSDGDMPEISEVKEDLWNFLEFSNFTQKFNSLKQKCTEHFFELSALNDNTEILKDLKKDFKYLYSKFKIDCFAVLRESFENYTRDDEEITYHDYKEKYGEYKNFDAWLSNFAQWIEGQEFITKKEVLNA